MSIFCLCSWWLDRPVSKVACCWYIETEKRWMYLTVINLFHKKVVGERDRLMGFNRFRSSKQFSSFGMLAPNNKIQGERYSATACQRGATAWRSPCNRLPMPLEPKGTAYLRLFTFFLVPEFYFAQAKECYCSCTLSSDFTSIAKTTEYCQLKDFLCEYVKNLSSM